MENTKKEDNTYVWFAIWCIFMMIMCSCKKNNKQPEQINNQPITSVITPTLASKTSTLEFLVNDMCNVKTPIASATISLYNTQSDLDSNKLYLSGTTLYNGKLGFIVKYKPDLYYYIVKAYTKCSNNIVQYNGSIMSDSVYIINKEVNLIK